MEHWGINMKDKHLFIATGLMMLGLVVMGIFPLWLMGIIILISAVLAIPLALAMPYIRGDK